ncbi:rhomboid family intramembrane serine protease [Myceligenerans salitolerans]|uniref:Rhomboid family intramembrane serine protease n=1 Tax=Myceligenerans salitolerans TaxID=1230528 RepID=A0ABS3I5G6_9MICO|nr:rhomboid family intramembrane serine protease [Myceligenerans salitolerans]
MADDEARPAPDAPAGPPVCPRHPDRPSYVRCQRCGRPACPECQRQAAVGIQCVDCVREAAKQAPRVTTTLGGNARTERPVVTFTIIGLCVVSFLLQLVPGLVWTERWLFSPMAGAVEPWRFLTVAFLHSTGMLLHIAFNMYALYITGQFLEPLLGRARFAALCVLAAVGGSVGFLLFAGLPGPLGVSWTQGTVGASGMVFGLFGAMLPVLRRTGRSAGQIVVLLVINGVLGFVVPHIAWQAHLGGLVTGLALGAAFAFAPRRSQRVIGVVAPAAVLLVVVLAAVAKYEIALRPILVPGQV